MSKSLCQGYLSLLLQIALGGLLTLVVLVHFRFQPAWYGFVGLFLVCCLVSVAMFALAGAALEHWKGGEDEDSVHDDNTQSTK